MDAEAADCYNFALFLTLKFDDEKQEEHANRHHEDRNHGGPTVRASAHHALDCSSR